MTGQEVSGSCSVQQNPLDRFKTPGRVQFVSSCMQDLTRNGLTPRLLQRVL